MRARDLGVVTDGLAPGRWNAITDVPGVKVGHCTIIEGEGALVPGRGPIRTGVTVITLRDDIYRRPVTAAVEVINGYGKATGLSQVAELGLVETPVALTGTLNVFRVADAVVDHMVKACPDIGVTSPTVNPVVFECSDAYLNDIQGRHVTRDHVAAALSAASGGPVAEGVVGAGTGMTAFGYKAGIGTASRVIAGDAGPVTLGVLVLANFGRRGELRIGGVKFDPGPDRVSTGPDGRGSVVVIAVTDAPLTDRQLRRLGSRAVVGLARVGGQIDHGSGEFVLSMSTASPTGMDEGSRKFADLLRAMAGATEEAVLNSLTSAVATTGRDGHRADRVDLARVRELAGGD